MFGRCRDWQIKEIGSFLVQYNETWRSNKTVARSAGDSDPCGLAVDFTEGHGGDVDSVFGGESYGGGGFWFGED